MQQFLIMIFGCGLIDRTNDGKIHWILMMHKLQRIWDGCLLDRGICEFGDLHGIRLIAYN